MSPKSNWTSPQKTNDYESKKPLDMKSKKLQDSESNKYLDITNAHQNSRAPIRWRQKEMMGCAGTRT